MAITYHAGRRIQAVPNEYKVHEFTSSGTLAVTGSGDIEYLVVAGGGGGYCGGGGAGGMRTGTLSVSAGNKTVTVGAGGYSGQCNVNGHGNNGVGGNSVFDSITSTGGGFGGGAGGANNTAGGSSGGAGGNYTSNGGYPQDSVTPNQGNNGGASDGNNSQRAGAGGGAGSVGGNATAGVAVGGDGLASSISGSSVIYAGGGGGGFANSSSGTGGQGGSGGGGSDGAAGTTNLGAGGGGHDNSARAGYGGSGIVIVRYLTSSGITATGGTITTVNAHDARPLNVQVGSRLEETDTRKMYYYADVSTDGLKAYYKFDESSGNIINQATSVGSSDSLGTDADMTISGATYSQTGKIGNALSFDGSNDYGTLGSSLSQWNFFHGTGDWSINFWINYDEFVAEDRFFSNMDSTETRGINFAVGWSGNPDGQIGLSIKSDNGFMTNNGGINFPSDISGTGTWVMITLVADYSDTTNTYTVYLNGVAGSSVARAVAGSTGDSEYSLKLASRGNYADRFFDGLFDEMTIWQRVLTADEITSLYDSNSGKAISSGIFTQWKELGT